jgi:hypothetical protein
MARPPDAASRHVVTLQEFREHFRVILLLLSIFGVIIVSGAAVSIAVDMHAIRANEVQGIAALRASIFSRVDALLWKVDTISAIASATNKSLARGLMEVRVQVKQSSEDQAKSIKATSNSAEKIVKQTLESNSAVLEKVADGQKPVVNVEVPKPTVAPPAIVVNPAPAPAVHALPRVTTAAEPAKKRRRFWRWLTWLWK